MDVLQAIVLFALGVGAAFLAYFAWQHVNLSVGISVGAPQNLKANRPAISTTV